MCMSTPSIPDAPPPAPTPPPAPAMPDPVAPTPPPELVATGEDDVAIKQKRTKRQQQQQASQGANNLRIPLSTGTAAGGQAKQGLSIPK